MDALERVLGESIELGTRSVTTNLQGIPTLRLHLEPEQPYVSALTVFLAHASADREWADAVHRLLSSLGFRVTYLREGNELLGGETAPLSPPALQERLAERISEADYLCLLLSRRSAERDWVRFELAHASHLIGRAVVLLEKGMDDAGFMRWPAFSQRAMMTARYTLLEYDDADPELPLRIGRALVNHPDEGVTDGSYRPLVVRERNLRRENRLRQFFRAFLDGVDEYARRHVVDVLPFDWSGCGVGAGDVPGVFSWFVRNHGRYNMRVQVSRRRLNVSIVQAPVTPAIADLVSTPTALALVLWVEEWDADDEQVNRVWWPNARTQSSMTLGGER